MYVVVIDDHDDDDDDDDDGGVPKPSYFPVFRNQLLLLHWAISCHPIQTQTDRHLLSVQTSGFPSHD